jgi:putative endonuclease
LSPENTTTVGRRGEDLARRHLESQGLKFLERNYRCRAGEIDLVMLEGPALVMVEVRLRTSTDHGSAAETVGPRKRRRFVLAARHLMLTRPAYRKLAARFDVVAIDIAGSSRAPAVTWIRDAFRA